MESVSRKIYVAIIADDECHCRALYRMLLAAHFQPVTYSSAEAFLADTKRPRFDCLLIELQLSGMSGLDLSRTLSDVNDVTRVVFFTAHDDPALRVQAESSSSAAFFCKTDPGNSVLDAVRLAVNPEGFDSAPKPSAAATEKSLD